jgi:hypothetical protein
MFKPVLKPMLAASLCCWFYCAAAHAEASLTPQETRWLRAAGPVLAYSQRLHLPIDIVVQPTSGPGDVPMAMGFDGKRCKLVLSMRGNPQAEAILDRLAEAERGYAVEAIAAHEIGHCWRYAHGVWHALPAGFAEAGAPAADSSSGSNLAQAKALRDSRREEGYADLVALAWTARRHPAQYARVVDWLETVRARQPGARGAHDTRAWVALARDAGAFERSATPFDAAGVLWSKGLLVGD